MLSVAKEAADKVIQALLRADENTAAKFNNVQASPEFANTTDEENSLPARRSTTPENNQPRQNETRQESVKLGPFARTCNPSKWEADI